MKLLERIILGIIRRPIKSLVMFCMFFVVTSFLSGSLILYNATQSTYDNINKQIVPTVELITPVDSFSVEDLGKDKLSLTYEEANEIFINLKKSIEEISKLSEVKYYDSSVKYGSFSNAFYKEDNITNNELKTFGYDGIFNSGGAFLYKGERLITVNNSIPYHFEMEYLKLIDGRYFTQEEIENGANVAIMNKYSSVVVDGKEKVTEVGDKFKISLKVLDESINQYNLQMNLSEEDVVNFKEDFFNAELYNDVVEVEVIGLFEKEIDIDSYGKIEAIVPNLFTDKMYDKYLDAIESLEMNGKNIIPIYITFGVGFNDTYRSFKYNYFILNDTEDIESFKEQSIEILKKHDLGDYLDYILFDFGNEMYLKVIGPLQSMNSISKTMLLLSVIVTIFVVGIVSIIMTKDRYKEIGILLSMGENKKRIMLQILCEIVLISTLACCVASISTQSFNKEIGEMIYDSKVESVQNSIFEEQIQGYTQDSIYEIVEEKLDSNNLYIILLSNLFVILISGCSVVLIMKLNPKDILM